MEGHLSETPPDTEQSPTRTQVQWPRASLPPTRSGRLDCEREQMDEHCMQLASAFSVNSA